MLIGLYMAHPLRLWRVLNGDLSLKELGDKLGVTAASLSYMENNKLVPSLALAKRIEKLTDGAVKVGDFIPVKSHKSA